MSCGWSAGSPTPPTSRPGTSSTPPPSRRHDPLAPRSSRVSPSPAYWSSSNSRRRFLGEAAVTGPRSVVVVGGGVAGLCSAYYLRRLGVDVTLVESNRVGSGASWGNGGWLCPAQAGPLPEPGLTWY